MVESCVSSPRRQAVDVGKALGATRFNILTQFLTEALTTGAVGGMLGIALGVRIAVAMANLAGFNTYVSIKAVVLAVGVSVDVGLIFGVWPAHRATQLDPVEALRHD